MFLTSDAMYADIVADLASRYSDTITTGQAQAAVAQARAELEPVSRHPEFLALLVTRRASDLLHRQIEGNGERFHSVPTVLFVCEHNSGRSQMASAFAERMAGEHVHVRSAGAHERGALDPTVVAVMAEDGIDLHALYTRGPQDLLHAADVVVEMGAHCDELVGKSYRSWPVSDPAGAPVEQVRRIRDEIGSRVERLLAELQVPVGATRRANA